MGCVLHCKSFPASHSGINITVNFESMINNWEIPKKKHLILRDGVYNMKLGTDIAVYTSFSCFIRKLQLVIKDYLFSQRTVSDIIKKCRNICTHFNHSSLSCSELKTIQRDLNPHLARPLMLVQDVNTRRNSIYLMLKRTECLKRALQLYNAEQSNIQALIANEWQVLEKC